MMKITKILSLTALCALATLSSPSYANQAKFNKIEQTLRQCNSVARQALIRKEGELPWWFVAYDDNQCNIKAVNSYKKLMNASQKAKFARAQRDCIFEKAYADSPDIYRGEEEYEDLVASIGLDEDSVAYCQLKAVRRITNQR